jgi:glutaconyl-CoA/methylmalonyl-CoA decarboxylase subunit gamma
MRYYVTLGDRELAVDVDPQPDGRVAVAVDGVPVEVDVADTGATVHVRVGERGFDLFLEGEGPDLAYVAGDVRARARVESERQRVAARASKTGGRGGGQIVAPMPGRVVKVLVAEGDLVEAGAPLVVVEAMKMENELATDAPGVVTAVHAQAGQQIEGGAVLVELGPLPSGQEA